MKNLFKNTFLPNEKHLSLAEYLKNGKNQLLLAKKSVSTSRNKVSLKKDATPEFKNLQQSSE